jgi:hypothetical protein
MLEGVSLCRNVNVRWEVWMTRLWAARPLALGALAFALGAAGGAYAADAGGGAITVCVHHNDGGLYKAGRCARHDRKLTWNMQGPRGPQGKAGAQGQPGAQGIQGPKGDAGQTGTAGPGFQFTSTTGNPGPTLSAAGTYYVVVKANISSGAGALTGNCTAVNNPPNPTLDVLAGAIALPAGGFAPFSFSGMVVEPAAGHLQLNCQDTTGTAVTPSLIQWWVSPIGS